MAHRPNPWMSMAKGALLASCICPAVSLQAQPDSLSFGEAEQRLVSVRQVLIQAADVEARAQERKALNNLNLPQVSLIVAGIAYEKDVSFDIPFINQRADLNINKEALRSQMTVMWPLYTGGRTRATQALASSRVAEAQAEQMLVQLRLLKRLADLYFSSQMMQQVVAVREQSEQTLAQHLQRATRFKQEGLITELGRMQAEVAHAEATRELLLARRQYTDVQAALANLLELEQASACLATALPTPQEPTNDMNWFVQQARANNPVYRQLAEKFSQTQQAVAIEKGKRLPEFFATASYDLDPEAVPLTEPEWAVGVGLRYNFTTPVGRNASIRAALSRQEQVRLSQAQADADIQLGVESSYRAVLEHWEQYRLLQEDIALAQQHTRLQQRAFEEGLSTSLELTDAELGLAATRVKALNAAFLYVSSLAHLTQLAGQPQLLPELLPALAQQQACSGS